ncbi:hypothetical protein LCGC14_0770590 [marine sediment metagenome]|uniref:Uncharacterized protein n=1 Tax=marine sediment metagenome TaxID=412755 RepID=A0A0F9T5D9_9ZZZZ
MEIYNYNMGIMGIINIPYCFYNYYMGLKMTGMRIDIKSGEYYDYFKIMRVEILEHYIVKIKGNFSKGTKSKIAQIHYNSIRNIKELNRFLKKEMKEFHADGACPYCDSLNVFKVGTVVYNMRLNEPKEKYKYNTYALGGYHCKSCKRVNHELKPVDLVIYYK